MLTIIIPIFVLFLAGCVSAPPPSAAASGNAERGAQLFLQGWSNTPACSTCHHTVTGQYGFSIGPTLAGIAERAGARVEGMSAGEYLRQSILEPHDYVVSGYRDIMYPDYRTHLGEQDIEDLIAYLLTL
jgi:cytochrome c553